MGVARQHQAPVTLPPGRKPGTHCTGGWMGPRDCLDGSRKISPPTGIRSPDRPACSEWLYYCIDVYFLCHIFSAFLVSCTAYNRRDSKHQPHRSRARQDDSEVRYLASRPCFVPTGCALSMPASSGVRRDLVGEEGTRRGLTSYRGQWRTSPNSPSSIDLLLHIKLRPPAHLLNLFFWVPASASYCLQWVVRQTQT
jgi:hypothetical protein